MIEPSERPLPLDGIASDRGERAVLWLVALAPVVIAFAGRDLWSPDEPRYAQVAREILRDGRWLVPYVNGAPYAEKPPLFFALVALVSAPFGGVTALAARLVGALFATGSILLVARLARLWFTDRKMGVTAAILFATMGLVGWNASRAGLDLPLAFFVLAAVERLTVWANGGGAGAAALGGLAWAGAILVKGPMGFFMPPLALAGGFVAARRGVPLRTAWVAPLVMVAAGLAWLLPALASGDEAYRARLLGQIGDRVSGEERGHVRPVWYYALGVLGQALPWTLHLLAGFALVGRVRAAPSQDRFGLGVALAGCLVTLAILTVVATKREVYMIPPLAFGAIAAAYAVHRGLFPRLQLLGRMLTFGVLAVLAVASAVGLFVAPRFVDPSFRELVSPADLGLLLPTLAAAVVFGVGAWAVWRLRGALPAVPIRAAAVALVGGGILIALTWFPRLDPVLSWRSAARTALANAPPDVRVAEHGIWQPGVLLWSFDPVRRIETLRTRDDVARALDPQGPKTIVLVEERAWNALGLPAARILWKGRVAHRRIVIALSYGV